MSADGHTIAVGAGSDDVGNQIDQGSAYVFTRSGRTWTQQAHLIWNVLSGKPMTPRGPPRFFGMSVAISGDAKTILVSALEGEVAGAKDQGSTYVYRRSGAAWIQEARLIPSGGNPDDHGESALALSFDGNTALVGAESHAAVPTDQGTIFIFTRANGKWSQHSRLLATEGARGDLFGISGVLKPDGTMALMGAHLDDVDGINNLGSVFEFQLIPGPSVPVQSESK